MVLSSNVAASPLSIFLDLRTLSTGKPLSSPLNQHVIGMSLDQLARVERAVGIAGGRRKLEAIRAVLHGRLINALITDHFTAEGLL